jgi:hypothetical protein
MAADHFTPARSPQKPTQIAQFPQTTGTNADFADFHRFLLFIFPAGRKKKIGGIGEIGVGPCFYIFRLREKRICGISEIGVGSWYLCNR